VQRILSRRRRLCLDWRGHRRRRLRHDHPSDEVGDDPANDPARNHGQYGPHQPHNRRIYAEVFGKAPAHSRDLYISGRPHQPPVRKYRPHPASAVGAKVPSFINFPVAFRADHNFLHNPPPTPIIRQISIGGSNLLCPQLAPPTSIPRYSKPKTMGRRHQLFKGT